MWLNLPSDWSLCVSTSQRSILNNNDSSCISEILEKKGWKPPHSHINTFFFSTTEKEWVTCRTFITQQSSPVDVAHTLPRFSAAPIHTAWERHTLVAQLTLPAILTPKRKRRRRHEQRGRLEQPRISLSVLWSCCCYDSYRNAIGMFRWWFYLLH